MNIFHYFVTNTTIYSNFLIMKFPFESLFKDLLVIDIETASAKEGYDQLDPRLQSLWDKKATFLQRSEEFTPEELYFMKGAIFAEFGKIICISAGVFIRDEDNKTGMRIKSFASNDESDILNSFKQLIETKFNEKSLRLVAHNGKEFDFPYLCRRMLVNDIAIPEALGEVDPGILDPRNTYADVGQWDEKARNLASLFVENFTKYEDTEEGKALAAAGPVLH